VGFTFWLWALPLLGCGLYLLELWALSFDDGLYLLVVGFTYLIVGFVLFLWVMFLSHA
jgi:hypothetical protein